MKSFLSRKSLMKTVELDKIDVAILRCLQRDCRMSFRDIAGEVGVSVPTVSARVSTLEQLGVLRGYRAQIDPGSLNEVRVVLLIKCKPQASEAVAEKISEFDEVRIAQIMRGSRILAEAVFADQRRINEFLGKVNEISDLVDYDHYVSMRVVKDEPAALLSDSLTVDLICFQCKGLIKGEPIKIRMDGRDHYLCCRSCERLYVGKYEKLKSRAKAVS